MRHWIWTIVLIANLMACATKRNPAACCETPEECQRLGTTEAIFCNTGQCVNFTCVGDNTCDSPDDCISRECVNGLCSSSSGVPAFDVAYPDVWRRSLPDQIPFDLIVIATNSTALSMSSLQLKSISDDHPTANVRLIFQALSTMVPAHQAGGKIVQLAEPVLIGSGLVTETRADTNTSYVEWEVQDAPPGTYDITVNAVLTLDGIDVPLHFIVHMVAGPTIYLDPEQGTRAKLTRKVP